MQSVWRYGMTLLAGGVAGYLLAVGSTASPVAAGQPAAAVIVSQAPGCADMEKATARPATTPVVAGAEAGAAIATAQAPAQQAGELPEVTLDESWLQFMEQHYPPVLRPTLSQFPDKVKQQIQAFYQSEVDVLWAAQTEQQLADLLQAQKDGQYLQISRIHCRQQGCEIYGESLKPNALEVFHRQLAVFGAADTISTRPGSQELSQHRFYLLLSGMKKD